MSTPTYFPQLSSGTSTQLPYSIAPAFDSVISDLPTGPRYTYAKRSTELYRWEANYPAITDANLATLEAFFADRQGRLQPFTFLDPAGNLAHYSEDFSQSAWVKTTLTLGAAVADPFGGNAATSITGTGADSHMACYVLPDGGASGYRLCGSVWAKAAGSGQTLLIGLADDLLNILGQQTWALPQGQWVRIWFGMRLATADKIKLLIGGFNSWSAGQVISLFGAQCAPTPGPGAYMKTPGNYGLHSSCRFDTDRLEARATEHNSWSVKLPIQEFA